MSLILLLSHASRFSFDEINMLFYFTFANLRWLCLTCQTILSFHFFACDWANRIWTWLCIFFPACDFSIFVWISYVVLFFYCSDDAGDDEDKGTEREEGIITCASSLCTIYMTCCVKLAMRYGKSYTCFANGNVFRERCVRCSDALCCAKWGSSLSDRGYNAHYWTVCNDARDEDVDED